ncbi:hypothetical protein FE257_005852 [Aspergillus nanangensis]|uniref:RTA1 domain protein n=1 Tax=Aspergillus nanangensis TaxID=2582783 RepID=A0AAD4CRL0_ASPNN|nr:hypothetical protein FE257_005852 [Aspergillus nanangensis]
MRLHHIVSLFLPILATAVDATPAPTATQGIEQRILPRETTTNPYDPHITFSLDLPTISIPTVSIPSLTLNLPTNTCTPTIAPDENGWVPPTECNALYQYYPSLKTAIAFSVLFGIVMIAHFIQATFYETGFVWVILMGAIWECVGFVTRAASTRDQQNTTLATITQMFILLSPLWVNAFDYMVLARLIWFFIPDHRIGIFKPSILALIFVTLDFGSFIIQLIGGGMAGVGQPPDQIQKGLHIYMAGIGLQEFFICLFLVIAVQFHRQMLQLDRKQRLVGVKVKWRWLLYALYASLFFITVRIVFRLIEFSSGTNAATNSMLHREWFIYAFDAVPMLLAILVWNIVHPGTVLQGPDAKMPPSALRKVLFSCCRNRKNKRQKIPVEDPAVGDEMMLLQERQRPSSAYRPSSYN